jgi:hypothetical protein
MIFDIYYNEQIKELQNHHHKKHMTVLVVKFVKNIIDFHYALIVLRHYYFQNCHLS